MNREDILKMEAGPEMDALVAEHVMGWEHIKEDEPFRLHKDRGGCITAYGVEIFPYEGTIPRAWRASTDIAAAWMVVEAMHLFDDRYIIETTNGWGIYAVAPHYEVAKELVLDAETAPLAICRAALLAVMEFDQ